ncbi:Stage II sporulation protein M [uncultured archaeon]|nr:Stage II sporulation protein M [uncultured archaeon]
MAKKRVNYAKSKNEKKSSLNDFFYGNFKLALKSLAQFKTYIIFSFILFFALAVFGFAFPKLFEKQVLDLVKQLIEQTKGLTGFQLIAYIIANNIKSAFVGLLFGVLFAIPPIIILVVNGYVLGFVASKAAASQSIFVLWKLFPHGIFEIPAIMISVAIGIRLGLFLFIYHGKHKWREFSSWIVDAVRVFVFIVIPLLVVAGIIEGALISWLG